MNTTTTTTTAQTTVTVEVTERPWGTSYNTVCSDCGIVLGGSPDSRTAREYAGGHLRRYHRA